MLALSTDSHRRGPHGRTTIAAFAWLGRREWRLHGQSSHRSKYHYHIGGSGCLCQHFIPEGNLIGPAPALHMNKSILSIPPANLHGWMWLLSNQHNGHRESSSAGIELLLWNPDMSISLCPYGIVTSLINHSKENASAKLEWNFKLCLNPKQLNLSPTCW